MEIILLIILFITMLWFIKLNITFSKRNKRNKKLIETVNTFSNEKLYFESCDNFIATVNDDEFIAKGKIVKLWGMIYFKKLNDVVNYAKTINFKNLIKDKRTFELNEDSFYYYLIANYNTLYSLNKIEMIKSLDSIIDIHNELENRLIHSISRAFLKFYYKEDDLGETFLTSVIDGNYIGYKYSKALIGLYKNLVICVLIRIYLDKGKNADELINDIKLVKDQHIVKRFLKELKIDIKENDNDEKLKD